MLTHIFSHLYDYKQCLTYFFFWSDVNSRFLIRHMEVEFDSNLNLLELSVFLLKVGGFFSGTTASSANKNWSQRRSTVYAGWIWATSRRFSYYVPVTCRFIKIILFYAVKQCYPINERLTVEDNQEADFILYNKII